jgi:hypothetical protein
VVLSFLRLWLEFGRPDGAELDNLRKSSTLLCFIARAMLMGVAREFRIACAIGNGMYA